MSRLGLRRTPPSAPLAPVRPAAQVAVDTLLLRDDGVIPNHPTLPAVLLREALQAPIAPPAVMARFEANGWLRVWHASVLGYDHYHPNAHEVLAVVAGWADLLLGGPSGEMVRVVAGDVAVLPAGTGHCLIDGRADFAVCGAYPRGQQERELIRGIRANRGDNAERVRAVALPDTDPVYGADGPLLAAWGVRAR